jgi:tRNA(Ile)-lysidine synthetase-like protein
MDVSIEPGVYVVAVSGGVDSMVLLDVLSKQPDLSIVVAHFDHGIRPNSSSDADFVAQKAGEYGLAFELGRANLGPNASEAKAREARYEFLRSVVKKHNDIALLTAHHQDDVIETALINMIRGTNYKGYYALRTRKDIARPLLAESKATIIEYAKKHELAWVEDETNQDEKYLRNYLRKNILPKMSQADRKKLVDSLFNLQISGDELERATQTILHHIAKDNVLDRQAFIALSHSAAKELLAAYLRDVCVVFDKKTLERLVVELKTARVGKTIDVQKGAIFEIGSKDIRINMSKKI